MSAAVPDTKICAAAPGKDACQGDSGGPLTALMADGERCAAVGVVSYGISCADPKYPGIYTNVRHFAKWIRNIIAVGQRLIKLKVHFSFPFFANLRLTVSAAKTRSSRTPTCIRTATCLAPTSAPSRDTFTVIWETPLHSSF